MRSTVKTKVQLGTLYKSEFIKEKKKHLLVLVHGYGGSRYDVGTLKSFFTKIIPHSIFLCSQSNEEMEGYTIEQLGKRLADEVIQEVNIFTNISKISFVGHSLGGIIIRACLPHLSHIKGKLFTYVSLSSPHLGTKKNSSFLVNTGVFFLTKIKKDKVIRELNMDDSSNLRETYLYKLSQNDKLHWFNNVLLFSSPQDKYVPYHSARIQPENSSGSEIKKVLYEMGNNIWTPVKNDLVVRVDVDLRSSER
jgi:predicted esterase